MIASQISGPFSVEYSYPLYVERMKYSACPMSVTEMSALSLNNLTLLRKEHIARVHNLQQLVTDKAL